MNKKYRVGQVLFVVLNKQMRVIPCQVVEENRKKTLKGDSVAYKVLIGQNGETQDLADLDGEIFTDAEELKSSLKQRAATTIEKMVTVAVNTARKWYVSPVNVSHLDEQDVNHVPLSNASDEDDEVHETSEENLVEIDGKLVKVNVKLPENFSA